MASVEPYIGSVDMVAFPWAPQSWALAQGQTMPISQNITLFYVLGTFFGGDGRTTIGLPDMRGRAPIGQGAGPGLSNRPMGEAIGTESVALSSEQMPAHEHVVQLGSGAGTAAPAAASASAAGTSSTGIVGAGRPVPTMPPSLAVNWIICLEGLYPVQN